MSDFPVIYQNHKLVIINKPAGVSFHSENGEAGAFELLSQQLQTQLWPLHRLDKITSGLLMFAKDQASASQMGDLFANRKVDKTYIAISDKKPKKKQGKVIGDMQKSRNGSWMLLKSRKNPASTEFYTCSLIPGMRFFWLKPATGKTHQLRVAMKSLGSPLLGDRRYAGTDADRGYLHAYRLSFPWEGKTMQFYALPTQGKYFLLPELSHCVEYFKQKEKLK